MSSVVPTGEFSEPVGPRPRWLSREEFVRLVDGHQADPALLRELRELAPDTTDDLPSWG